MDQSPGSAERRANLIREMARCSDRTAGHGSDISSNASANGDRNPYETNSQQMGPVRLNQDYQLNSSAIRRAFPDFSQGASSDDDSIEVGRGQKKSSKGPVNDSVLSEDVTEDMPFTFGNGAEYRITATPPMKPKSKSFKSSSRLKPATTARSGAFQDDEDKENSENPIRKLPHMRPTVEPEDSELLVPSTAEEQHQTSKGAKLGSRKSKMMDDYESAAQNGTNTSIISAGHGTYQSFMLPNMPNITELISGVRQDGTPLFTRNGKPRSRFATPSQGKRSGGAKHAHMPITNVALEAEDKALYASLQLLQEKVKTLEAEKSQTEEKLGEYEMEVLQLKSKLDELEHRRHNSDSGLGTDPEEVKVKTPIDEKSRLELSIKTLQDRLNHANHKVSKSELTIQTLHKDRDAAHQQLAVAFLNSEELKNESQAMRDEIEQVKGHVARLNRNHEKKLEQLSRQENELRGKIDRREKAINEMSSLVKELWKTRKAIESSEDPSAARQQPQYRSTESLQTKKTRTTLPKHGSKAKAFKNDPAFGQSQSRADLEDVATTLNTRRVHQINNTRQAEFLAANNEVSDGDSTTHIRFERPSLHEADVSKNSTYMSFMEGDEVAKLQRIVDEDKQKLVSIHGESSARPSTGHAAENPPLPRKSSLKKVSYDHAHQDVIRDTNKAESASGAVRPHSGKRYSLPPLFDQDDRGRQQSRLPEQPDLTSAFILPDITINSKHMLGQSKEQTKTISRPVPVSERQLYVAMDEDDMTVRPAQSPGIALAKVLSSLEGELEQLRIQVAQQETLYNQHDPALSKHKRKMVYARIQKMLTAMETRADQIHALYDVLEGQRASGQAMKEDEVEVTLQNIGIDTDILRRHGLSSSKKSANEAQPTAQADKQNRIDNDDEETDDISWKGIDPTQTQTIDSAGRFGGRSFGF